METPIRAFFFYLNSTKTFHSPKAPSPIGKNYSRPDTEETNIHMLAYVSPGKYLGKDRIFLLQCFTSLPNPGIT